MAPSYLPQQMKRPIWCDASLIHLFQGRDARGFLLKDKVATISMLVINLITLLAIFLPIFWLYSYNTQLGMQPGHPVDPSFRPLII